MTRYFKVICPLILTLGLLSESPAQAQATVVVTPSSLTIAGTKGSVETRTLVLRAKEPVNSLRVTAFDLLNPNGTMVFPATSITANTVKPSTNKSTANDLVSIAASDLVSIPITFDFQSVPSGEFTGEMLLSYQGNEQVVPVIVRVKDPPLIPLLTLLFGVGLSMAVSAYSIGGRQRDEISSTVQQLRLQAGPDSKVSGSFWNRANMHLVMAESARDAKQWEEAERLIGEARTVWGKWLAHRNDWLVQLEQHEQLKARLSGDALNKPGSRYIKSVKLSVDAVLQKLPDFITPSELKQDLDKLDQQIDDYLKLIDELAELKNLCSSLEDAEQQQCKSRADTLEKELNTLSPSDQADKLEELRTKIQEAIWEAQPLEAKSPQVFLDQSKGLHDKNESEVLEQIAVEILAEAGKKRESRHWWSRAIEPLQLGADGRLGLFYVASYLIVLTVLAGGGFRDLYVNRSTFGADRWSDYLGLLAWGFGAEATRSAVTKVVRNWDSFGGAKGINEPQNKA